MSPLRTGALLVIALSVVMAILLANASSSKTTSQATTTPNAATTSDASVGLPIIPVAAAAIIPDTVQTISNLSNALGISKPAYPTEFLYIFNVKESFSETQSSSASPSKYWWLDSGAWLIATGEHGQTIQGELPPNDPWRKDYALSNPSDSDNGFHPQNIFRLVSKALWNNVREDVYFRITADNFSSSHNRNESNGILLMSRYQDHGDTLYYAGLRVDGTAVIKKKYNGTYYTMAQQSIIPGTYSRDANINLLPHNEWIGLRMETITNEDGTVTVKLYMGSDHSWLLLLSATDSHNTYGATATIPEGRIGIRTDFMDVQFKNFHAEQI